MVKWSDECGGEGSKKESRDEAWEDEARLACARALLKLGAWCSGVAGRLREW